MNSKSAVETKERETNLKNKQTTRSIQHGCVVYLAARSYEETEGTSLSLDGVKYSFFLWKEAISTLKKYYNTFFSAQYKLPYSCEKIDLNRQPTSHLHTS